LSDAKSRSNRHGPVRDWVRPGGERDAYFHLMDSRPELFRSEPDGIRLVTDKAEIEKIEMTMRGNLAQRGENPDCATVGLFYADPYIWLIRDAVVFPDGSPGVHHRVIYHCADGDITGVGVLAALDDKIVLVRHYRHPIANWSWEIPRGGIGKGKTEESAVHNELAEEIGARGLSGLHRLGPVHGGPSLMRGTVALYFAKIERFERPNRGEGIVEVQAIPVERLEKMIADSAITDSYTICAFANARLKGLL